MDERALRELDAAMARVADGDRSACPLVFDRLWPDLVTFAARTLGPGPDAEDAAQEALEKLFANAANYDPHRPTLAWALAVVAWECKTVARRRGRRRERPLDDGVGGLSDSALGPEAAAEESAMIDALRGAFEALSEEDRSTLVSTITRDASGPASPALRKRKERAIERLRRAWRRIHGE